MKRAELYTDEPLPTRANPAILVVCAVMVLAACAVVVTAVVVIETMPW